MKVGIKLLLLLALSGSITAQITISGYVRDAATKEGLPLANIQATTGNLLATADENGYFSFSSGSRPPDSLRLTYVGYLPRIISTNWFTFNGAEEVLLQTNAQLPTVEVRVPKNTYGPSTAVMTPSVTELTRLPAVLGEVDLIKSLALLPGVSGGTEGSAALSIRGGNANQTDLLIDGNRVYNVNHFGGYLSALPPFAVKAMTVHKGGMPPRFGGRLSGVVDILLKEGRRDKVIGSATVGLGTFRAGVEGPVGKGGSFVATGRYSYPTLIANIANANRYKRNEYGYYSTVGMYDAVAKYRQRFDRHTLTASVFVSGDKGFDQDDSDLILYSDDFRWGNRSVTLEHRYLRPSGGVWTSAAQYLNYAFDYDIRAIPKVSEDLALGRERNTLRNNIQDFVVRTEYVQPLGKVGNLALGLTVIQHRFLTDAVDEYTDEAITLSTERAIDQQALEMAGYLTANIRTFNDRFNMMAGLRMTGLDEVLPHNVEPRLRVSYDICYGIDIHASLDRNYQYVHQLSPELALFPNELYLVGDDRFGAERSDQIAIGIGGLHQSIVWSVEGFYKDQRDLLRIRPGREQDKRFIDVFPDNLIGNGKGRVKGMEVYLKREQESFSYSLAYTLSRSERQYAEVNEGKWFPFTFDRRHDIGLTLSKALNERWRLNGSFVYQTGYSFTAPIARSSFLTIFGPYNGTRLPPFHVLNLSATKSWRGKKRKNHYHSITYSIYNVYNRANAYAVDMIPSRSIVVDPVTGNEVEIVRIRVVTESLLPILPGISYTMTFQ